MDLRESMALGGRRFCPLRAVQQLSARIKPWPAQEKPP